MILNFKHIYEAAPIDVWEKSLSLKKGFGLFAHDVRMLINEKVYRIAGEYPHTIKCGIVGNPSNFNFEITIYAKVSNNGTVYIFTDADLEGNSEIITEIN